MRDIEFRGKLINTNEWRYGLIEHTYDDWTIHSNDDHYCCKIAVGTIGQYMGLKDRNGVKIFEGDIVKLINGALFEICYGFFLPNLIKEYCKKISLKANKIIGFYGKHLAGGVEGAEGAEGEEVVLTDYSAAYEVIGNIHDNPELLHANNF